MKKIGLLNSDISKVISEMGHTDMLVICDAGFPIPKEVERIDLAITEGFPNFFEVLEKVLIELEVEKVIIAKESEEYNPDFRKKVKEIFKDKDYEEVEHIKFKELSRNARAVIRTADITPYSNIILVSGVTYL